MPRRDEPLDLDDDDDRPRARKPGGLPVWGWALIGLGIFFGLATVVTAIALFAGKRDRRERDPDVVVVENSKPVPPTQPEPAKITPIPDVDPDAQLKQNPQDLDEYASYLKKSVTFDIKSFQNQTKFVAESYEKDERYTQYYIVLVIKIDPVYLTDKTTKQTAKYTRARMIRNNPAPARFNPRGGITSVPEPFEWKRVEFLP